jgi:hypothetical protein
MEDQGSGTLAARADFARCAIMMIEPGGRLILDRP